eukprot:1864009-Amphidinium_carterae.1
MRKIFPKTSNKKRAFESDSCAKTSKSMLRCYDSSEECIVTRTHPFCMGSSVVLCSENDGILLPNLAQDKYASCLLQYPNSLLSQVPSSQIVPAHP